MKKRLSYVLSALLVIAGIAVLAALALANKAASRTDQWAQAIGTIEKAGLRAGVLELSYRYDVGGSQQRNAAGTIAVRDGSDNAALLERYGSGRPVLIYVNPSNPAESVLEHPRRPSPWPIYPGVFLIILGLALAIFSTRLQESRREPVQPRRPSPPMSRLRPPPPVKRS